MSKADGQRRARECCDRCSKTYHSGETRYVLNFESFADIDIDADEDEAPASPADEFEDSGIVQDGYGMQADDPHGDDIEERVRLVVCKSCHDTITSSFKKILAKRVSAPSHHVH